MPKLTQEIEDTLREYTHLQKKEQELTQRKHELQDKLKSCFRGETQYIWNPEVDRTRLKVSYRSVPHVEYNEEILRKRLGDRYSALLEPDIRKIRAELPSLEEELKPLLDRIGSPSPEKVKTAVKSGTVTSEEFKGAFTKMLKEYVSVATLNREE
ncbi:MAG: hypothetical protein JXR23_07915 [Pontiellaceae bacterium]|nr:hypothetical protein [Pontiellaceae bacterium]